MNIAGKWLCCGSGKQTTWQGNGAAIPAFKRRRTGELSCVKYILISESRRRAE